MERFHGKSVINEEEERVTSRNAIFVLDERRRAALAEIDNAKFLWFHAKVCVVAGVGFFTDAYDIFAINIASTMLGYVYGDGQTSSKIQDRGQILESQQDLGVKVATPVGTLCGQILFGWLADMVGRKKMYGFELMIMIVATFGQAVAGSAPAVNIIGVLVVWRFIMGIGVGGDYPLSAVIASEFASKKIRGRMMTAVFAFQGWGQFTAALVAFIVTVAYKNSILNSASTTQLYPVDNLWRLLIGLGCVPNCIALYLRLTIPETPRFTMDIERNIDRATYDIKNALVEQQKPIGDDVFVTRIDAPKASFADFSNYFSKPRNLKILFGTAYSWFALDVAYYGLGLNNSTILKTIGFGSPVTPGVYGVYPNLSNICIGNMIISVAGLIPGYWVSFLLIDKWGRRPIQLLGFTMLTICFIILGFGFDKLNATPSAKKGFVLVYCLTNFFFNFGPNTTTFIVPGELFPTRYRSTGHGISAASGKLGAIIAQVGFSKLQDIGGAPGSGMFVKHLLEIFTFFMLTGVFSTLLLPETKGETLEDLSYQDMLRTLK